MINFDDFIKETAKEHNPNWPQIPDHLYRILITGSSGSGKTNSLFKLICQQSDIDKICLYAKNSYKTKYQILINKRESSDLKHLNYFKTYIDFSNDMNDIYRNNEENNPNKKVKF